MFVSVSVLVLALVFCLDPFSSSSFLGVIVSFVCLDVVLRGYIPRFVIVVQRLYNDVEDPELAAKYAWAIPDERAIRVLLAHSPLVEIGSGRG
jgi:hypothetical protein